MSITGQQLGAQVVTALKSLKPEEARNQNLIWQTICTPIAQAIEDPDIDPPIAGTYINITSITLDSKGRVIAIIADKAP